MGERQRAGGAKRRSDPAKCSATQKRRDWRRRDSIVGLFVTVDRGTRTKASAILSRALAATRKVDGERRTVHRGAATTGLRSLLPSHSLPLDNSRRQPFEMGIDPRLKGGPLIGRRPWLARRGRYRFAHWVHHFFFLPQVTKLDRRPEHYDLVRRSRETRVPQSTRFFCNPRRGTVRNIRANTVEFTYSSRELVEG